MNETRKTILREFLINLSLIADKEYQRRIWIKGIGPEVHSFEDAICDFFDLGECIFTNYERYNISKENQIILENFKDNLKKFSDENDWPELFIDSPEWTTITVMAKKILEAFHYSKNQR